MAGMELFLQGEGERAIRVIEVPASGTVGDILTAAKDRGFVTLGAPAELLVFVEDADVELAVETTLAAAGIGEHHAVHIHRCRRVQVTVHFGSQSKQHEFAPGATIRRVKVWAVGPHGFNLPPVDATEHVLQITGTQDRPDEDVHVGTLVHAPHCAIAFDLVPKVRVEG